MTSALPFIRTTGIGTSLGEVVPGKVGYVIHLDGFVISLGNFSSVTQGAQLQFGPLADNSSDDNANGGLNINLNPSTTQNVNFALNFGSDNVRATGENTNIKAALGTSDSLPTVNFTLWGRYVPVSE